jgi:hypothetical protein
VRRWAFRAAVLLSLVLLFVPRTPSEGGVYGLDKLVHLSLFAPVVATPVRWWAGDWHGDKPRARLSRVSGAEPSSVSSGRDSRVARRVVG